jgi:diaminohydroxyphosphoribosylaminopyrimidine deaminase/5-amino-6-(5-phosphoribosylamino)uracil reductase
MPKTQQAIFYFHRKKRPYVILKWAQTEDGFIARENFDSKWISNSQSRQLVHKWRAEEDAILVGKNTAKYDNPSLTVRDWKGKNPIRIVIDNRLELSSDLNLFDGAVPTIVMNRTKDDQSQNLIHLTYDGSVNELLSKLYDQKIQSVIVEGGAKVLETFINENLWDEARVFTSTENFVSGIKAPKITGQLTSDTNHTGDRLEIYENSN